MGLIRARLRASGLMAYRLVHTVTEGAAMGPSFGYRNVPQVDFIFS